MSSGFYNSSPLENRRTTQENGVGHVHTHQNSTNNFSPIFPRSNFTRGLPVQNPRRGTHDVWLPYQERAMRLPFPFTRIPTPLHSHVHIFVLDNDFPRMPLHYHHPPRYISQVNDQSSPTEESKLSKEEQNNALSKLRKETYNPSTASSKKTYKPNYYIRDWDIIFSRKNKENENNNNNNEDGKRCAICLEDFEAKEIVTLTPCNHIFHDDCIVPWVTSQGRCPVCRFAICERVREGGAESQQGNSNGEMVRGDGMFGRDFISVIRGMEDEFEWDQRPFR